MDTKVNLIGLGLFIIACIFAVYIGGIGSVIPVVVGGFGATLLVDKDDVEEVEITFENFLADKHGKEYTGLDDMMSQDFENWMETLSNEELINWAEEWGNIIIKQ